VHIHAPYNPSFFMLAPFALPAGTIGVGTYHSVFTPGRVRDLVHAPTRASLSRLDGHIVVSDACIEPLDHYFPEFSWRVIPNGIDEEHFAPTAAPIAALRESGDPVVLFLGRFDPRNGLGIMLDAFSEVWRAREGRVRLAVVGDGPLRRYYQGRLAPEVADAVHWAGRIDWNRPRYYCSADVFCTPCQRASFGMVLLEAMSCGRPVVASLISGFERLLTSGREGLLAHRRARRLCRRAPPPARLARRAEPHGGRGPPHRDRALLLEQRGGGARGLLSRAARRGAPAARTARTPGRLPATRGTRARLTRCPAWHDSPRPGSRPSPGWR
jgi:phosphatidylinositol alpha-mannosyltransferase